MLLVFALAATLWGLGMLTGASRRARLVMIAALLIGVLILQIVLPDGHSLREATGGSVELWLLAGGMFGLVFVYGLGLRALRFDNRQVLMEIDGVMQVIAAVVEERLGNLRK